MSSSVVELQANAKSLEESIKSHGHWKLVCHPLRFHKTRISNRIQIPDIVKPAVVLLRGWDYPHLESHDYYYDDDFYQSMCDWQIHKEIVRFYQSGQYVHLLGLREDYLLQYHDTIPASRIPPNGMPFLDIMSVVLTLSEFFEFARRLVRVKEGDKVIYPGGIHCSIQLIGNSGRALTVLDPMRGWHGFDYLGRSDVIAFDDAYTAEQLDKESKKLAIERACVIFANYDWKNPAIENLRDVQSRLFTRTL